MILKSTHSMGFYWNLNLFRHCDIPCRPATYISLALGIHKQDKLWFVSLGVIMGCKKYLRRCVRGLIWAANTQISMHIDDVWLENSLSIWGNSSVWIDNTSTQSHKRIHLFTIGQRVNTLKRLCRYIGWMNQSLEVA